MMAESHNKSEVSTATTVTTTYQRTARPSSGISLCLQYFKTGPGIIKLIEIVIGIICMACVAPAWNSGAHWFLFVVVVAFATTVLWCFIYLLNLRSAINMPIDWLLTELILTALFVVLYFIASIVQIQSSVTKPRPPTRLKPFYILSGVKYLKNVLNMWKCGRHRERQNQYHNILFQELLNTSLTTLLYLIACIVIFCSVEGRPDKAISGGVFGIFNMLVYAAGSFYLYRDWKDSHPHSSITGSVLKRNP